MVFAFHQAAIGDNWLTDGQIGKPYGSVTDSSSRAIGLELSENGVNGTIPPELGKLTHLEPRSLSKNRSAGYVPQIWRQAMSNDFDELGTPYCVAKWTFREKCQTDRYEMLRISAHFKGIRQEEIEVENTCIKTPGWSSERFGG